MWVSGSSVNVKATTANTADERSGSFYVTYNGCRSNNFTVKQKEGSNADEMVIGNVAWTKYNLKHPAQAPGGATFAKKLPSECGLGTREESHGGFYQWGINRSWWTTTDAAMGQVPSGMWNNDNSSSPSNWSSGPCPTDYRLPTEAEFQTLINSCSVSRGGSEWNYYDYGYIRLSNGSDFIEFPAVGNRDGEGNLSNKGSNGNYWSSTKHATYNKAYNMRFNRSYLGGEYSNKYLGYNVRCVRSIN